MDKSQADEILKCAVDFPYFCGTYLRTHSEFGIVPFNLFDYQVRLFEHLEENKKVIFSKFKGGGFTTVMLAYSLWLCLFRENYNICYMSQDGVKSVESTSEFGSLLRCLPKWMVGAVKRMGISTVNKNAGVRSMFETGSEINFIREDIKPMYSKPITVFIVDEASLIPKMAELWLAVKSLITGQAIIFSTFNTDCDWFCNTLDFAKIKVNDFSVYECSYLEHPELAKKEKSEKLKSLFGQSEWEIEYEQKPIVIEDEQNAKVVKKKYRSLDDE